MAYDDDTNPANDPLVPLSVPIPGLPQGAITGIRGVWTPQEENFGAYGMGMPSGVASKIFNSVVDPIKKFYGGPATSQAMGADAFEQPDPGRTPGTVADAIATSKAPEGSLTDMMSPRVLAGSMAQPQANKLDVWGGTSPGTMQVGQRAAEPFNSYATARTNETPPEAPAAEADSSGGNPGAPLAVHPAQTPNPPLTKESGQDIFGNSMLGRGLSQAFNGFMNWRDQNRMTLLALAGGLAGSQSIGQGLGRGFTAAASAIPQQNALNNQNATINYLMKSGMPPDLARSISANPQLMQGVLGEMTGLEPPKTQVLQSPMGASLMQWNPQTRKWEPAVGGGANLPANWESMTPTERLNSLDPTTRGMVQTVLEGGAIPPARMAYIMGLAKQVDPTFTENDYNANKTMATDLEKNTPGSNGGNLLKGLSSFEHVADWATAAANVGGYSGPNIPGGGLIGSGVTAVGRMAADPALDTKLKTEKTQATHAGQEATAYYSMSGGGEGERTAIVNGSTGYGVTPASKAGAVFGEAQLMKAKIEQQMQKVLSNPAGKRFFSRPENQELLQRYQDNLNRIDAALGRMDPNGVAGRVSNAPRTQTPPQTQGQQQAPPQLPRMASPADAARLPSGTHFLDANGVERIRP